MNPYHRRALNKVCATAVAASMLLQPLVAYAATITPTLRRGPLQGLNPVKPNIMYTMDDSGSMGWDFLPDYTGFVTSSIYHCRDGQCGGATSAPGSGYTFSQYDPPIRSSAYNGLYYDPDPLVPYNSERNQTPPIFRSRRPPPVRGQRSIRIATRAIRAPRPVRRSTSRQRRALRQRH